MGKTIFVLTDDNRNPISDSIVVTITKTTSPFTVFTGTKIPSIGNNNGTRVFTDVTDGDYTVKFDGNTQSDLSPLHVAGPGTIVNSTVGTGEVNTVQLADNAVTTIKITDLNVTTNKIANNAVTSSKLAAGAVDGTSLADASVIKTKLGPSIFAASMEDVSGWGPKVDGTTIDKSSGTLRVPDNGIASVKIASDAITEIKIANGAVTVNKIGTGAVGTNQLADGAILSAKIANAAVSNDKVEDGAITINKIFDGSVSTEKIASGAVTQSKLGMNAVGGANIGAEAVSINHLDVSLKNSMVRFPTDVAYVSPEFNNNVAPYFDNIPAAYEWIDDNKGTIYIYPGIYTTPILMGEAVNLIGMDKTRCLLEIIPDSTNNFGIKVTSASKPVLFKNLTIKVEATTSLGTALYGIWFDTPGSNFIRLEDLVIYVKTKVNSIVKPDQAIGIYLNGANFRLERSYIQVKGGNYGSVYTSGDALGIYLAGSSVGVISDCQISTKNKGSVSDRTTGIYYLNSTDDVDILNCTIGIEDTGSATKYTFESFVANTILVMNTLYSSTKDSNTTITTVASTESANVIIKDAF